MLAMENSTSCRQNKDSQFRSPFKQRRSGYEPSDAESEWQESPRREVKCWEDHAIHQAPVLLTSPKTPPNLARNISPLSRRQRFLTNYERASSSLATPVRNNSRSPHRAHPGEDDIVSRRPDASPLAESRGRKHVSPHKLRKDDTTEEDDEELKGSGGYRISQKFMDLEENGYGAPPFRFAEAPSLQASRRKFASAPRLRAKEEQKDTTAAFPTRGHRSPSPLSRTQQQINHNQKERVRSTTPRSQLKEMVANAKLQQNGQLNTALMTSSTDSITPGDIFFSRDYPTLQKRTGRANAADGIETNLTPNERTGVPGGSGRQQRMNQQQSLMGSGHRAGFEKTKKAQDQVSVLSTTHDSKLASTTTSLSSATRTSGRSSSVKFSQEMSGASGKTSGSFRKFTANRQRSQQADTWFAACVRGPCSASRSPDKKRNMIPIDEASFIEKAFVVESLRQFWADKHRPASLNGFTCHKQQAQYLKQLISHNNCPHILFKGPSGSGRKALCMALLREIYGSSAWKISHELKYVHVQEARPLEVVFPLTSSPHHMELNLRTTETKNARYALMALVKEIVTNHASVPEVSDASLKADYKVIVLYEVDNLPENIQHLIKWIMDCYTDACKIILCCEDDSNILESIKGRCKLVTVDAPVTHEIMEVLIQIARKENFELAMSFAATIANKSKQNLRRAMMALEACKAQNYPFIDDQPIALGWEEVVVELASEVLADPSPNRPFLARAKFQKLLVDFVHPKLILQKMVEQFLKGVELSQKRELYYWYAYYDKRLPTGTSALSKLEEFVAKFAGILRKGFYGGRLA